MNINPYFALLGSLYSGNNKKSHLFDFFSALVVALFVGIVSWRISIALGSSSVFAALYAVPVILSVRGMAQAFFSLIGIVILGIILLETSPYRDLKPIEFLFSGAALMSALLFYNMTTGNRIHDLRVVLLNLLTSAKRVSCALESAGVCLIVLDKNLSWINASETVLSATGCDICLVPHLNGRAEFDDEAVSALMHSGSREAWRNLVETIRADATLSTSKSSQPRHLTLYGASGKSREYLFTVTRGLGEEFVFLGIPTHSELPTTNP